MSLTHVGAAAAAGAAIMVAALLLGVGWYQRVAVQAPLVKAAVGIPGLAGTRSWPPAPRRVSRLRASRAPTWRGCTPPSRRPPGGHRRHRQRQRVRARAVGQSAVCSGHRPVCRHVAGAHGGRAHGAPPAGPVDGQRPSLSVAVLYLSLSDGHGQGLIRVVALPKGGAASV